MSFQSFDWISLVLIPALSLAPAPSEWNAITRNDAWIQSCKHLPMKIFSNLNIWNSELSTANSMQTGNANLIHYTVIWQTCSLWAQPRINKVRKWKLSTKCKWSASFWLKSWQKTTLVHTCTRCQLIQHLIKVSTQYARMRLHGCTHSANPPNERHLDGN